MSRLIGLARSRGWVLLLALLLGTAGGLFLATALRPTFTSTATVFFSVDRGATVSEFTAGNTYAEALVPSYASVATTPLVLDPVISQLRLPTTSDALARQITVTAQANTVLMDIKVSSPTPALAARTANAVANQLGVVVSRLSPRGGVDAPEVKVTVTSPAVAPPSAASTSGALLVVAGIAAGLLVGVALVTALELGSRPIRTARDVAAATAAPVLGTIGRDRRGSRWPVPSSTHPRLPRAEQYAVLRANVQATSQPTAIVVTSPRSRDGRTATAVNLAVALSHVSLRVALVDADLRHPGVAEVLQLESAPGLSSVLAGLVPLQSALQEWQEDAVADRPSEPGRVAARLDVLQAGPIPTSPAELLASPGMLAVLAELRASHDVVVIDTPPLLPVADAAIVGAQIGRALLVLDSRRVRRRHVTDSIERLRLAGATVSGVVLNNAPQGLRTGRYGSAPEPGVDVAARAVAAR